MKRITRALPVVLVVAGAIACGGGGASGGQPTEAATRHYGASPDPGADVTWQPDVVFLDGGAGAIRAASADGRTWDVDADAAGADDLEPGSVLYASSLAVGRVVTIEDGDGTRRVTLAPVDLGDVIEEGRIQVSQPLDLDGVVLRSIPEAPGAVSDVDALQQSMRVTSDAGTEEHQIVPVAHHRPMAVTLPTLPPMPPPFTQGSTTWSAGSWSGEIRRNSGDIRFHAEHQSDDLKAIGDLSFKFVTPHLDADLGIVGGEVGDAAIELRGLRQVTLALRAGSASGLTANLNQKIEVPVSLDQPVIVGGIALNLNVTFKFVLQTAFTAKNSSLDAVGVWKTDGPLAFDRTNGKVSVVAPTITPEVNILDSLKGVSIGVNGIVFVTEMRVMLGLGVPAANAGPYARLITSVGLTVGSDIGFAGQALKCRQATVTVTGAFGAGLALSKSAATALNFLFNQLGSAQTIDDENLEDLASEVLYSKSFWSPDLDYCKLAP